LIGEKARYARNRLFKGFWSRSPIPPLENASVRQDVRWVEATRIGSITLNSEILPSLRAASTEPTGDEPRRPLRENSGRSTPRPHDGTFCQGRGKRVAFGSRRMLV